MTARTSIAAGTGTRETFPFGRHSLCLSTSGENTGSNSRGTAHLRVDVVISAASGLALRGYMRSSIDPAFPWEHELARTMATASAGLSHALSLTCGAPLVFERASCGAAMQRETVRLKSGPLNGIAIVIGDGVEVIDGSALVEATRPDTGTRISAEPKDGRAHRITIRTNEADIVYERTTDDDMTYQREERHG